MSLIFMVGDLTKADCSTMGHLTIMSACQIPTMQSPTCARGGAVTESRNTILIAGCITDMILIYHITIAI